LRGDFDKAIDSLDEAKEAFPTSYIFWEMMAKVQLEKGELELAHSNIVEAIQDDPNSPSYQLLLAQIEKERGNTAESKKALSNALGTWKNADTEFNLFQEALSLQKELK